MTTTRYKGLALLLLAAPLAACAEDNDDMAAGLGNAALVTDGTGCRLGQVLVVSSDFTNATESRLLNLVTGQVTVGPAPTDLDSIPVQLDCQAGLLERGSAELSILDVGGTMTDHLELAAGAEPYAMNPQAVLNVAPDKAFVVQQAASRLSVLNPSSGDVEAEVDLSRLAKDGDADGSVDAADAILVGDRAFVALGNYWFDMDFAIQFEGSALALVDVANNQLLDADPDADGIQAISLTGNNPWRGMVHDDAAGRLIVASTGDSFALDGGLEAVDLSTLRTTGMLVTEQELGAEIDGFAQIDSDRLLILAGRRVQRWDLSAGAAIDTLAEGVDGMHVHGRFVLTWAQVNGESLVRIHDQDSGAERTPGDTPFALGSLPIVGTESVP